jgi:hypothetical protein
MRETCEKFIRNEEFVIPNHATACALKPNSWNPITDKQAFRLCS